MSLSTYNMNSRFYDEFMLLEKDHYAGFIRIKRNIVHVSESLKRCYVVICLLYSHQLPCALQHYMFGATKRTKCHYM